MAGQLREEIGVPATARRGPKPCLDIFRLPFMRYAFLFKPAAHASPDALSGRAMAVPNTKLAPLVPGNRNGLEPCASA